MSLSEGARALVVLVEETAEHGEPLIHPYLVGGLALGVLLAALAAVVAFGAGREHS
jgi:acyl dehydratase